MQVLAGVAADPPRLAPPRIRPTESADLASVAALHTRQLPHGFFARLGPRYLVAYHRTFMESPSARSLVAEVDGVVRGFVVGPVDASAHHEYSVRHHGRRLAAQGAAALAVRPAVAVEFLRTRVGRYVRSVRRVSRPPSAPAPSGDPTAVLSHVAVEPGCGGAGIGTALVHAFVGEVSAAGARRVELVTLEGDAGAAGFYEALGWQHAGTSRREGQAFERFVLEP